MRDLLTRKISAELDEEIGEILQTIFSNSPSLRGESKLYMCQQIVSRWCIKNGRIFRVNTVTFIVTVDHLEESDDWPNLKRNIDMAILDLHKDQRFARFDFDIEYKPIEY